MDYNAAIYEEYHNFVVISLNDTLQETKEAIKNNSLYKYGDLEEKLRVIEDLKNDHATHFNFLNVKGVQYNNGGIEILEPEFKELILLHKVNLVTRDNGLFENENDKTKPFAYKGYIQVISILTHCLKLQILMEAKRELENPQPLQLNFIPNLTVFKNPESHRFFDYLYNAWLKEIKECRPELSYIVRAMIEPKKGNVINDFAITCPSLKDFAEFWNKTYSSHPFKLKFENSKINLSDYGAKKYEAPFDNHKKYFRDNML